MRGLAHHFHYNFDRSGTPMHHHHTDTVTDTLHNLAASPASHHTHTHTHTQDLPGTVSIPGAPLVMVGDDSHSRMCLVNDTKSWGDVMQLKGVGPCPRAAQGTCNCNK